MVFIVKAAYNMAIVKKAKHTKICNGNPNSGLERCLQMLYIYHIIYIQGFYCENRLMLRS